MTPHRIHAIADDLSGAAECAAVIAQASGKATALVLRGELPASGSCAIDTDSRAMPERLAAQSATATLQRVASEQAPHAFLFKKIDSTLRGHVAEELRAALAVPGLLRAAVVCPTLPQQGRSLRDGVLHVNGEPHRDAEGRLVNLLSLLSACQPFPIRLSASAGTPMEFARELVAAIEAGNRVLAIDGRDEGDLRCLAQAIVMASDASGRILSVGSAGLAKALAGLVTQGASTFAHYRAGTDTPTVAVVGSFSPMSVQQVDVLAQQPGIHLVRLTAQVWLNDSHRVSRAMADVSPQGSVVLAVTGEPPPKSTRALVQCMAAAAGPIIRNAGTLLLTGGDTARAVLDWMGIDCLQVLGELEPGVCISRVGHGDMPYVVTKAGGFGDRQSLLRALRQTTATTTLIENEAE